MKFRRSLLLSCSSSLATLVLASSHASAANLTWNATTADAAWATGSNWVGGSAPTSSDDVTINAGGNAISLSTNSTIQWLTITGSSGRILQNTSVGSTANLTLGAANSSGNLIDLSYAGYTGTPTFNIRNNGGSGGTLGLVLGASGAIRVSGTAQGQATLTIGSNISQSGGTRDLLKTGNGILNLGGTNSYTGNTIAREGYLNFTTRNSLPGTLIIGDNTSGNSTQLIQVNFDGSSNNQNFTNNITFVENGQSQAKTLLSRVGNVTLSGNITVAKNTTLGAGANNTLIISGLITGSSSGVALVLQNNPGTVLLTNSNNDFNNGVVNSLGVTRGTLLLQGNDTATAGTVGILGRGTGALTLGGGGNANENARILTNGAHSIARAVNMNQGTAGTFNTLGGNTADNSTFSGAITLASGSSTTNQLTAATGGTVNFTNVISGTATNGLSKIGNGTVVLSGNNTYSGNTSINAGTLQIASNGRLGGGTYTGTISNNGTFIYSASGNTTQRLNGVISGSGSLTYNGSSTVVLAGNNTYSGGTTLAGSGLVAVDVSSVGSAGSPSSSAFGTGTVNLAGAQVRAAVTDNRSVANAVTISADTTFATVATEKSLTFTGPVTLSGATRTLDVAVGSTVNTANLTFSGAIGDGGNGYGLTKNGTGTLIFAGANTYSGTTTVNAGALNVTSTGSLASGSAFTLGASATANLANAGQTLGAVSNANSASNALNFSAASGSVTLASLSGAGNTRFGSDAVITAGIGSGTVNAIGSLTANITGGTVGAGSLIAGSVSGGTTTVGGVATIGAMSAGTANLNGATSSITTLSGGNIALGNSTVLSVSSGSSSGIISGGGGLNKTGAGSLELLGANSYTGNTTVSQGTLAVNGSLAGGVTVINGATLQGNGTISGATTIGGSLNPGNSPGLLIFANSVTLQSTASTTMEIVGSGLRGVDYDAVNVGGELVYGGTLTLDFSGPVYGEGIYSFNLFDFGSQSGGFTSMSLAGLYTGALINNAGVWGYTQGDNTWSFNQGDGVLTFTVVPEPNVAMVVGSLALMTLLRRRRD